jgi:multiple sugar transport system substrate-binding protein
MKRGVAVHIAAAVSVLVSACSTAVPEAGSSQNGGTVTITWFAGPFLGRNDWDQAMIDAFEQANPSIKVDLIPGPANTDAKRDTLKSLIDAGQDTPDVYLSDVIWPAMLGHDRLALPLDGRLPRTFWDRFPRDLVQTATYRGRIYQAPFYSNLGLLFYRSDLLTREGMPVPTTWEQLVSEAQRLQRKGLVPYGFIFTGAAYEGLTCVWTEVQRDAGGQTLDAAGTRSEIDSSQSLGALRFLRDLVEEGVTPTGAATYQEADVTQVFGSGEAAFARQWNNRYFDLSDPTLAVAGKFAVAPLPAFAGQSAPGYATTGGWGLSVNPHTRHLAAALAFIDWLTNVPAQRMMATLFSQIPANDAVRNDPAVIAASPVLATVNRSKPVARPSGTPAYPDVSRAISGSVNDALAGRVTPEVALRKADQSIAAAVKP